MAGSDPWARVVWVVSLGPTEGSPLDSAWETFEAANLRARAIGAVRVARVPLEPPSGDVIRPEIELWKRGGRGRRPGVVGPGDDAA